MELPKDGGFRRTNHTRVPFWSHENDKAPDGKEKDREKGREGKDRTSGSTVADDFQNIQKRQKPRRESTHMVPTQTELLLKRLYNPHHRRIIIP